MNTATRPVGELLRDWRQRRRLSQLDLALEADVSARHVSFLETGRSHPSREMLLRLADQLDLSLRDRNTLLVAGGYAPIFPERALDDPELRAARAAIDLVLAGHEPYPALAIDRHWNLVAANPAVAPLLAGVRTELLQPPLNVLRLSLHPDGLAPRIANLGQWRGHLLDRLRHQIEVTADPALVELMAELRAYPGSSTDGEAGAAIDQDIARMVVPLQLRTECGLLALFSTTTVFGTPVDVTLSELAIESFFPADRASADRLRALMEGAPSVAESARSSL
jgi:transcriptional regulator with XRE-family HTH domain